MLMRCWIGNLNLKLVKRKKILRSITDTITFQGSQGLALRMHTDDSRYHPDGVQYSTCV